MAQPLPRVAAYEDMALGLFVHWGLYSLLGCGEWTELIHSRPREEYESLFNKFTAEDFDARELVHAAKDMGARYIVLTAKHHEGFFLYDTKGLSDFDAPHSPAGRDLVREFVDACNDEGIAPFFYMASYDWHSSLYDKNFDAYLEYLKTSVEILCCNYGEIGGFWFDGNWDKPDADWKLSELYGMIRTLQPDAIIVNNTGLCDRGAIVDPEIDVTTYERCIPGEVNHGEADGKYVAGETSITTNMHWGHASNDLNYKGPGELIETIADARRAGANILVNVGPTGTGAIPVLVREYMRLIGRWMHMAAPAVYKGRPSSDLASTEEARDFILDANGESYLFIYDLLVGGNKYVTLGGEGPTPRSFIGAKKPIARITWLDDGSSVPFMQDVSQGLLTVDAKGFTYGSDWVVRVARVEYQ